MPNLTTNLSLNKPLVNNATDEDLWGGYLNDNMDTLDSQAVTATLDRNFADKTQSRMSLKDYGEKKTSPSSSSGTLTLDIENGNHFTVTLTENVTTLTISHWPAGTVLGVITLVLKQDATGSRTFAWPASVKNTAPTITATASKADVYTIMSWDNGTSLIVNTVVQNVTGLGI